MELSRLQQTTVRLGEIQVGGAESAQRCGDLGAEGPKPSGMYRFGQALVNAFKPMVMWRGMSGTRESKDSLVPPEKQVMQERQAKAEKAYAEFKKRGFPGTAGFPGTLDGSAIPTVKDEKVAEECRPALRRDSGVEVDDYRSSVEPDREDPSSHLGQKLMPPPRAFAAAHSGNSTSATGSPSKPSLHFRKPSLQNLKKVTSYMQLPSARKRPILETLEPSTQPKEADGLTGPHPVLRNQPSKKDIMKQQKLSKKVSDLETQLGIARRNLELSMHSPMAEPEVHRSRGANPFRPGALPSLLSERNLNQQGEAGMVSGIEKPALATFPERTIVTRSTAARAYEVCSSDPTSQLHNELRNSFDRHSESRKRKGETHDEGTLHQPRWNNSETKQGDVKDIRPKKTHRPSPHLHEIDGQERNLAQVSRPKTSKPTPKTSRNSPSPAKEPSPVLPHLSTEFYPVQMDRTKPEPMQSTHGRDIRLGRRPEGLMDFRKAFPAITDGQIVEYAVGVREESKTAIDHRSLTHHHQSTIPLLAPPLSASPVKKTLSTGSKPQASPTKTSRDDHHKLFAPTTTSTNLSTGRETSQDGVSKFRNSILSPDLRLSVEDRQIENEKPLPSPQKEDYEWPEDVF